MMVCVTFKTPIAEKPTARIDGLVSAPPLAKKPLTDDLDDERPSDVDLRLEKPAINNAHRGERGEVDRHKLQAGLLDREVLLLRHVLDAHPLLRVRLPLDRRDHLPLDAAILEVDDAADDDAAEEHAAADREEAQPDVRLGEEGVGRLVEHGDARGHAVEDRVDDAVEEQEECDVGVEEELEWVVEAAVWGPGCVVDVAPSALATDDGDEGGVPTRRWDAAIADVRAQCLGHEPTHTAISDMSFCSQWR